MPNEMTPGMSTQAKKPAFDPKGDISPIPMGPPAPVQQPKSIREYLQALQAGQTPTFTNVPGQDGAFSPEQGAMVFKDIQPGAGGGEVVPYAPGEAGPRGAIPEQDEDPANKPMTGTNPYQMAAQRLPHILDDVWETTFPGRSYEDFVSDDERAEWKNRVMHVSNDLVKRYEGKIKKSETDAMQLIKNFTGESVSAFQKTGDWATLEKRIDWDKVYERGMKQYDKLSEYDPIKDSMDQEQYAQNYMDKVRKALGDQMSRDGKSKVSALDIPEELKSDAEAAGIIYRDLTSPETKPRPMTHEQAIQAVLSRYPQLEPYI